jgi:16S rRNA (cytosine967-C5)-methyltransferase
LLDCFRDDLYIQESLNDHLAQSSLSSADRRLATQLAYGVLRRRGTLDALLRPVVSRPPHQVDPVLREILRLGVFQLALLTHVPPHAAIHETVELAKGHQPRAAGFVNGVLRGVSRLLTDNHVTAPAADAIPLEQGQYRQLARPVFPEPGTSPVEYAAAAFALPRWLIERWQKRVGWEELLRLGFWFAGPPPLWLRCNTLKCTRADFLEMLANAQVEAVAGSHPQAVRLLRHASIRELPGYEQGLFSVQDESAMRVASAVTPVPGGRILDLCAAPGSKTAHLAELMGNHGHIVACDVDDDRLRTVAELNGRLGIDIVEAVRYHPEQNDEPPAGPFDAALVDVPCSNTGVLGRRPEVRWRLRPADFRSLVPLQTKLLIQAMERVRPGGVVVYSTCSIEPEENGRVVRAALQGLPHWTLGTESDAIPGLPADGGYCARLIHGG